MEAHHLITAHIALMLSIPNCHGNAGYSRPDPFCFCILIMKNLTNRTVPFHTQCVIGVLFYNLSRLAINSFHFH